LLVVIWNWKKKKFILGLRATLMTEANIIKGVLIKYLQENIKN